jgi:hypothetical protein
MKTTVEISDALAEAAKRLAMRERTTLRALIEAGLQKVLEERKQGRSFQLRDASFGGRGLQPEFRGADWERLREAAYGERGG